MPQILMPYTVHLDHTLRVTPLSTLFAKGDSNAHRFELTILRAGVQEDLSGCTVMCKFYRMADSTVVSVTGSVEDGKAVSVLKKACYDYIGRFALTIAIQKGEEEETTVFYGDGYMHGQRADTAISGEYIIYDINTLLEKIKEIEAATKEANTATANANTATANANTAAGTANNAASAANTAANAANAAAARLDGLTATATGLPTGSAPTVSVTTDADGARVLSFGIPKGDTGPQGPEGPKGADGTMTFEDLTDEQRESLRGPQGETGPQGPKGEKGDKGDTGAQGPQGETGPQGIQGVAGVGIAWIERTAGDGSPGTTDTYTITFSDGQTLQYGVTHGKNGATANQALNTTDTVTFKSVSAETVTANKVIGAVYA